MIVAFDRATGLNDTGCNKHWKGIAIKSPQHLEPEGLLAGDFQGHIELATNDREFSGMEINVKGQVR